jgi:hypothetical protein
LHHLHVTSETRNPSTRAVGDSPISASQSRRLAA